MRPSAFFATVLGLTLSVQAATISQDARCGSNFGGTTCEETAWGSCCSSQGWCGTTSDHCLPSKGCQSSFGSCTVKSLDASLTVSRVGNCGAESGQTCANSAFGNCCSQHSFCGSESAYCDSGCQSKYGSCNDVASSSPDPPLISTGTASANLPSTQPVSQDSRCGAGFADQTCKDSRYGNCCSKHFYCGSTDDYCRPDSCQKGYGDCNAASSSSSATVEDSISSSLVSSTSSLTVESSSTSTSASVTSSTLAPIAALLSSESSMLPASTQVSPVSSPAQSSSCVDQVILNPSFEDTTLAPWIVSTYNTNSATTGLKTDKPRTGLQNYQFETRGSDDSYVRLTQTVNVTPGQAYDVEIWAYADGSVNGCGVYPSYNSFSFGYLPPLGVSSYYVTKFSILASMTTESTGTLVLRYGCDTRGPGRKFYIDDITMTATPSTCLAVSNPALLPSSTASIASSVETSLAVSSSSLIDSMSIESSSSAAPSSSLEPLSSAQISTPTLDPTPDPTPTPLPAPGPRQILVDPSFEDPTGASWIFTSPGSGNGVSGIVTGNSQTGLRSARGHNNPMSPTGYTRYLFNIQQAVTLKPNTTYQLIIWAKQSRLGGCRYFAKISNTEFPTRRPTTTYTQYLYNVPPTVVGLQQFIIDVDCGNSATENSIWFDDVTLTERE